MMFTMWKMFLSKTFPVLLTLLIAQAGYAAGKHHPGYFTGNDWEGTPSQTRSIFVSEKTNGNVESEPTIITAAETKDHSERAKIDFFFKDNSKRANPLYAEKNGRVSYTTHFHGSRNLFSLLPKRTPPEYSKPDTTFRSGERTFLGVTMRGISQSLILERENMAVADLRRGDMERQKDKLVAHADTFTLIPTQATSQSEDSSESHRELTHVGVENEKDSRGSGMKNHKTQNDPDTPPTRTEGFPLRLLHSIGTRQTREKNFKQVSNPPASSSSYQRSGPFPPSTTFPQPFSPKDSQDIEYQDEERVRYGLPYGEPISRSSSRNIHADKGKEIRRMKRNAAGDQFTKNLSPHRPTSIAVGSAEKARKVHSEESRMKEEPTAHSPTPAEALDRLKLLVGEIVQELSQFKQKFTLRLIRMTERDDLTRLPEIMKDFQILPERPIFFIAGGLKAPALPVLPTTTEDPETSASITETAFTTPSTLGTTTSSEYLRDTILRNETIIASTHATDFLVSTTTLSPEVEATTPTASTSYLSSFPQVLTSWFGMKRTEEESSPTTSEKGFTESIDSDTETSPQPTHTNITTDHLEIDSFTTNPTTPAPAPVDRLTSEEMITGDSSETESFVDSGLSEEDPPDEHGTKSLRKRRSSSDTSDEMAFYLSLPIPPRMARTENPFEDNEPGVYYDFPVLPSFYRDYGLPRSWPYEHVIRQSQSVRDDDDSELTDVGEGLFLLPTLNSSPTPHKEEGEALRLSGSPGGDPPRESRAFDDHRETGINLHNINLTSPSPGEPLALSGESRSEGLHLQASQVAASNIPIDGNDNENIAPLLLSTEHLGNSPSHNNNGNDVWTPAISKQAQVASSSSSAYSKVVRSGTPATRDPSEKVSTNSVFYNATTSDAIEHTVHPLFTRNRNSSEVETILSPTPTSSASLLDKPNLEIVAKTAGLSTNAVPQPNEVSGTTSTLVESRDDDEALGTNPRLTLLSPEIVLQRNLQSPLNSVNSSTKVPIDIGESRTDFKDDFKESTSGMKSVYESETKVVEPIILPSVPSSSIPKTKVTKPISTTPTDSAGLLKEKNSLDIVKTANTGVNMPEKVDEKLNSKSPITPKPEIILQEPQHHITIMTSGTVINSHEMNNVSTSTGSPVNEYVHSKADNTSLKGTVTSTTANKTGTHNSVTEKPIEINAKIPSPILDAATSIIQSIFGFGTAPAPATNKPASESQVLNTTKAEEISVDRKKENKPEPQAVIPSPHRPISPAAVSNVFDAAPTTPTIGESQSLVSSLSEESLSNLSTKDAISPADNNGTNHLITQVITTQLDGSNNSHSSGYPPQVTLTNILTSAELFNEHKKSVVVASNISKTNEPSLVTLADNLDKRNSSLVTQPYSEYPISNSEESIGSGSKTPGDSNADHVFTEDQNGNQTEVEDPSASTYSVTQPEHNNNAFNKIVEQFDPANHPSLNVDSLGSLPTTSDIISLSSPILPQGPHVPSSLSNNPFVEEDDHNTFPFSPFHAPSNNDPGALFPVYQSNRLPTFHSNVPPYFPWIPMPMLPHFPQIPNPNLVTDYTASTVTNNAPVIATAAEMRLPLTVAQQSSFPQGSNAPHENSSHKRQEYLMHLYFPNI